MYRYLTALIFILPCGSAFAQYPQVAIPGSEVRKINSAIVKQDYELHILLPGNYAGNTKKYPVVYLMDSQWDFPLVKSLYGQQYYDGFIPELIIVGITWGGVRPDPDSLRARDYTPTSDGRIQQAGGADKFLSFMKEELFPFVENNYRALDTGRILMGCSLGGLFTLYTLFTQPALFDGYIAASPALGWDNQVMQKFEKEFSGAKLKSRARVYMTVGDVERSRPVYQKFAAKMTGRNYPATIHSKVLENTGHSGTKGETYSRGLQFIFRRPDLTPAPAVLSRYAGKYLTGQGDTIEFKDESGRLVMYASPGEKYILSAASDTAFYSRSEFLNISVRMDGSKVDGCWLHSYGSSRFLRKID
ncbi:MAG: alpha/beta hydrolase [Chitinophagaceae bacterium]|nr:MAG: alpha/beta hydrolase [Chitinophagaceae bacterium]